MIKLRALRRREHGSIGWGKKKQMGSLEEEEEDDDDDGIGCDDEEDWEGDR